MPIIRIIARHPVNEVSIGRLLDFAVIEKPADRPGDCGRRLGGPPLLPDDDPLPLGEKSLRPHDLVYGVLRKGKHEIHDREREKNIGVYKDPHRGTFSLEHPIEPTGSVRQAGFFGRAADLPPPFPPTLSTCLEGQYIGETHHAVSTIRQEGGRNIAGIEQPDDERA